MEDCRTCGHSGNCPVCEGFGYEFVGDGDGCRQCGHTGNCPTCGGAGEVVVLSGLALAIS